MVYIAGLLTTEEQQELESRGWELEDAPKELIDQKADYDAEQMKMVWVDTSMFEVMNGPDWDKGPKKDEDNWKAKLASGDEVTWNDPDEGKCSGVYKIVDINVFGPEEECPNCHNGTMGVEDGRLVCRGECGHDFGDLNMEDAVFSLVNEEGSEVEAFGHELS